MLATAKFIKDKFRNKKIYTACGFMKDKKYKEMIDIIASFSDEIFLIPTKVEKRELKENDYMNVLKKYKDKATMCTDYSDCFKKIMKKDGIILFTGSIYNYEHIDKILRDVI